MNRDTFRNLAGFLLAIALTFAVAVRATAQEEVETNPVTNFIMQTWQPNFGMLMNLIERPSSAVVAEQARRNLDRSLDAAATTAHWRLCNLMFGETDDTCGYNKPGGRLANQVRTWLLDSDFVLTLSDAERQELAVTAVEAIGKGRAKLTLEAIRPVYTTAFDVSAALDYQRWRQDWCNFTQIPSVSYAEPDRREGKPTAEECLDDPFVEFMMANLCEPSTSPHTCDLARVSWAYGFLTRRYMRHGEEGVEAFQALMLEMAEAAGVEVPLSPEAQAVAETVEKGLEKIDELLP